VGVTSTSPTDAWPEPIPSTDDVTRSEAPASSAQTEPTVDDTDPTGAVLLQQGVRVTAGLVALGLAAIGDGVRRTMPAPPPSDEPAPDHADAIGLTTGAFLGLTLLAGDRIADAIGRVSRTVGPPAS